MVDESIEKKVKKYLGSLKDHGISVSFGVVFGSQTGRKTDRWSDIDLLVVSSGLMAAGVARTLI